MPEKDRNTLEILKFELKFLEDGGYGRSPHAPRRAPYIFEDSPTCLNFNNAERTHPCSECLLTRLVPPELREREVPCRLIPLNDKGQTVETLYREGSQAEMEEALGAWLRREIGRIEAEQAQVR
jgi:hypothetical protein